ncbi:MAG: type II toxin-antitoxin system VapC family toxin [Devosia sp.]
MILADTSVWADHLRAADPRLSELLRDGEIVMHPFVLGEIALGFLRKRAEWLVRLGELPSVHVAEPEEVLQLIERQALIAAGVGYVDVHLLATALVSSKCWLWTRDKRLGAIASRLGVAANLAN